MPSAHAGRAANASNLVYHRPAGFTKSQVCLHLKCCRYFFPRSTERSRQIVQLTRSKRANLPLTDSMHTWEWTNFTKKKTACGTNKEHADCMNRQHCGSAELKLAIDLQQSFCSNFRNSAKRATDSSCVYSFSPRLTGLDLGAELPPR